MRNLVISSLFLAALVTGALFGASSDTSVAAQGEASGTFRVGERLTYHISFNRFPNVAYAETNVVSKGKIAGKEAYEVRSKFKTSNFMAVGSLFLDTDRTTYISPSDGSAFVVKSIDNSMGAPVESSVNYAEKSPGNFDLVAMIFKIRASGGIGSFSMYENDKLYNVSCQIIGTETVVTDAGDFPANLVEVKSDFLAENGFVGFRISLASDSSNIPVQFRLKRGKNLEYLGRLASIQLAPEPTPTPSPVAVASRTPRPTPAGTPKPPAYVPNQPLDALPFELGETLEYSVNSGPRNVGTFVISAAERKLVNDRDSLLLSATVTGAASNELFAVGNSIRSNVDPDTLAPFDIAVGFSGPLATFNQSARFDPESSRVILTNNQRIDVPVGTHNILSLLYAVRLFNLNPSKDTANRVNDTRVSVFWQGRANIFTLRPSAPQLITIGEQKIPAQLISISTGNPQLDALQIKVWLSSDERRIPVRLNIGQYQFELKLANIAIQP